MPSEESAQRLQQVLGDGLLREQRPLPPLPPGRAPAAGSARTEQGALGTQGCQRDPGAVHTLPTFPAAGGQVPHLCGHMSSSGSKSQTGGGGGRLLGGRAARRSPGLGQRLCRWDLRGQSARDRRASALRTGELFSEGPGRSAAARVQVGTPPGEEAPFLVLLRVSFSGKITSTDLSRVSLQWLSGRARLGTHYLCGFKTVIALEGPAGLWQPPGSSLMASLRRLHSGTIRLVASCWLALSTALKGGLVQAGLHPSWTRRVSTCRWPLLVCWSLGGLRPVAAAPCHRDCVHGTIEVNRKACSLRGPECSGVAQAGDPGHPPLAGQSL